jgi:hypothetical protein
MARMPKVRGTIGDGYMVKLHRSFLGSKAPEFELTRLADANRVAAQLRRCGGDGRTLRMTGDVDKINVGSRAANRIFLGGLLSLGHLRSPDVASRATPRSSAASVAIRLAEPKRDAVRWHWAVIPNAVDVGTFRLAIRGHVNKVLSLALPEIIRGLPQLELNAAGLPQYQPSQEPH